MTHLPFLCSERTRCDVCRTTQSINQAVQRGAFRLCTSCAWPRVVHEDDLLRLLLSGEASTVTGQPRRWFCC